MNCETEDIRQPKALSFRRHRDRNMSSPRYLVKNLLPETGIGLLSGQPGTYKSFLALKLGGAVATGQPFIIGHGTKRQGATLIFLSEGAGELPMRLEALAQAEHGGSVLPIYYCAHEVALLDPYARTIEAVTKIDAKITALQEEIIQRQQAAEAAVTVLKSLVGRGMTYSNAINKLRRANLSGEELLRLAAKSKSKNPKVHLAEPESDDDDDKNSADSQLEKLAAAVQNAHREAGFSKQQALAWAVDNLPEARWLTKLSKQKSLDRYGEQAAGYFDKMAGLQASGRGVTTDVSHTPPPKPPKVRRDPRDASDFDAGNARIADGRRTPDSGTFADRVKQLQNTGLNFDQASTQALRERGNPDAISP